MTIRDSNGIYGGTTNDPSVHPKGIKGRIDGTPAADDIGYKVTGTETAFAAQTDATTRTVANVSVPAGVWDIYAFGVISRAAGAATIAEFGLIISTSNTAAPNSLTEAKAGNCVTFHGSAGNYAMSATKFQAISHKISNVVVASPTTYYANLYENGATWDGNGGIYAVRRA